MTVGVAVVGTGFGCLTHVRALRAAGFDVQALVGRDPEKTAERARTVRDPARVHVDAGSARARRRRRGHDRDPAAHARRARPRGDRRGQARAVREAVHARRGRGAGLLDAADRAGVVHLLGAEMRFTPGQALLARVVRDGTIGDARLATFLMHIPLLADAASEVPGVVVGRRGRRRLARRARSARDRPGSARPSARSPA